jgi:thiamine biosynthesis lipoprotein
MSNPLRPTRRVALATGLGTLAALATGCSERGRFFAVPDGAAAHHFSGQTMGSSYNVKLAGTGLHDTLLRAAEQAVGAALQATVAGMSHYEPGSELSRLNRHTVGEAFAASQSLLQVLQTAQAVHRASSGSFDVTVGAAVDAWGFGPSRQPRQPLPAQAQRTLRAQAHPQALQLDTQSRSITRQAAVFTDLSGIAKGWGVDQAAQALDTLGIGHYMVEVGGEIRTRGQNAQGQAWQMAVEKPDAMPQQAYFILPLSGQSLATSGDYRNFYVHEGRRYTHEIDPSTAAPVHHTLASVSVVASDCTLADAWSTALFVAGPERGLALARQQGLAAYFVVRQGDGRFGSQATPAFAALGGRSVA